MFGQRLHGVGARVLNTAKTAPVEWVLFSAALLLFGALMSVIGLTSLVGHVSDTARGEPGRGLVQECNDRRVTRCEVNVTQPSERAQTLSIEPTTQPKVGSEIDLLFMPDGRVEAYSSSDWLWDSGLLVGGILLATLGAWRLLTGLDDPAE